MRRFRQIYDYGDVLGDEKLMKALNKYNFSLKRIFQHYVSSSHSSFNDDEDVDWEVIVEKDLRMNFYDFLLFCKRE